MHIKHVLDLELVDVEAIRKAGFKVAIDCVNSVGGIAIPALLKALGVKEVIELSAPPMVSFPTIQSHCLSTSQRFQTL